MISENFVYVGVVISFLGGLHYVIETLKGKTKPNRVSWFLWFLAPMIAFASQLDQGVGAQAWLTFSAGFNPFVVLLASFVSHKAQWKVSRLDIACGVLSLLGIVFWLSADAPNVAIVFSILADATAAIPTLIKSYRYPETETSTAFSSSIVASGLTLLSIDIWDFQHYAFTSYIFIICCTFVYFISVRPRLRTKRQIS
jgi:hypothetical protein